MTSITFDAAPAQRATSLLKHGYERRNTIPVLHYMRIAPVKGGMKLTMTDLDMEITVFVEADWIGSTKPFLIPFSAFDATVGLERGGRVTLEYDAANAVATISFAGLTAKLRCLSVVEDFPAMSGDDTLVDVRIGEPDLYRHFHMLRHCISDEETRYYLNGVCLLRHPEKKTLRTVATDGRRLGIYDSDTPWPSKAQGIYDKSLVDAVLACLRSDGNRTVTLWISPDDRTTKTKICVGDVTIKAKIIDGTFPDYTRVIPTHGAPFKVNLTAAGLNRPIRIVNAMTPERNRAVAIDAHKGLAAIHVVDHGDVSFPVEVASTGGEGDGNGLIGFNGKYLVDQGRRTPIFQLGYERGTEPARITCEDPNALYILMPMRL